MTRRPAPGGPKRARVPRARLGALALALAVALPAVAQAADFGEPPTSPEPVENGPASVAAGHFDGDLRTDLAVAGAESDDVSILLGDGTGDLAAAPSSPEPAGGSPSSVIVGDFNGDPQVDLAVTGFDSDDVSILLGDGAGDFTPAPSGPEPVGDGPLSVAAGDVDGDTDADLAVAGTGSDDVSILLGGGTGDFAPAPSGPEDTGNFPASVAFGEFNGDGEPDLATANQKSDNATILLGDGTGNFEAAATSNESAEDQPLSVGVGDFDRDGRDDLAVANSGSGDLTIMLSEGSEGNFVRPSTSPEEAGANPAYVQVGDLDADGLADLAVANFFSDDVTVRRGDGTGNLKEPPSSPEAAGNSPQGLAAGDLDGDDAVDLAVANRASDDVTVLLNEPIEGDGKECRGERATIVGTPGDDELTGTDGADVIRARGGRDLVRGRGEDDVVCGDGGKDDLRGGDGADDLYGEEGGDELRGSDGPDELRGNEGEDSLDGGDGADLVRGGSGRDACSGGGGDDDVEGCR